MPRLQEMAESTTLQKLMLTDTCSGCQMEVATLAESSWRHDADSIGWAKCQNRLSNEPPRS